MCATVMWPHSLKMTVCKILVLWSNYSGIVFCPRVSTNATSRKRDLCGSLHTDVLWRKLFWMRG